MHKEIERRFLFDGDIAALANIMVNASGVDIEDYYFNEYTRYRWIGIKCWVGIKCAGTLIRGEEECMLAVTPDRKEYLPRLRKKRFKVFYEGHTFEINVYKDIILALVEVELESADEEVILPYWCGKEVTNNKEYYNYNLWGELNKKYGRTNTISANSKNKQFNK